MRGPFHHQRKRAPGQTAFDHFESADVDLCFVLGIQRMEVRRRVIAPDGKAGSREPAFQHVKVIVIVLDVEYLHAPLAVCRLTHLLISRVS